MEKVRYVKRIELSRQFGITSEMVGNAICAVPRVQFCGIDKYPYDKCIEALYKHYCKKIVEYKERYELHHAQRWLKEYERLKSALDRIEIAYRECQDEQV